MNRRAKLLPSYLAIFALVPLASLARDNRQIQEIELDEHNVYAIPVSPARVTTISFPGPISAIDAALVTTDGKAQGLFQLAHKPGSYFFSVRSLVKGATTNVNVRWNNKTYVLELQDSPAPILSLIFKHEHEGKSSLARRVVTPSALVGLLDKAKAYAVLKASHPEALEQVDYVTYVEKPRVMDFDDYEIRIEEAFRFDPQDTVVFRILLKNKTEKEIAYQPQGFSLRVGERTYSQSISDASGVMPPKSDTPAYFAVTGTPSGGRNDISLKNDFTVLLARVEVGATEPELPAGGRGGFAK